VSEVEARRLLLAAFSSALQELIIKQGETRVTIAANNRTVQDAARKPQTFEEAQKLMEQATYHLLVELGGKKITDQSGINYIAGTAIGLPTDPQTMSKAEAAKILAAAAKNEEMEHAFSRVFKYRPWDGANALQLALKKVFGTAGEGAMQMTMFGPKPPEKIQIEVGVGKEISVPWGNINFPLLDAVIQTGVTRDHQFGDLFRLQITAPKKHAAAIEGLFVAIEQELKENSIYRGKAFVGVEKPMFLDPYKVERKKVVYAEEVFTRLNNSIWGPIKTAALQEKEGLALNVKAVLHGPYGTGKSLALALTAQTATENGWTFIQCTTGKDNLTQVMQTAALYAPCVVGIEDIDVLATAGNEEDNSKLLELFDGIAVKNNKVMVVMTSNRAAEMHKGMLRAGRIDAAIEIGPLDQPGVERLIKVSIPEGKLDTNIDWPRVHVAMEGYEPAFIKETFVSAQRAAIVRAESLHYRLTTEDFEAAALLLRPQHELHEGAKEKSDQLGIGDLIERHIESTLQRHKVDEDYGTILPIESQN
jgi:transitional endoplasmic reticulum ATPase